MRVPRVPQLEARDEPANIPVTAITLLRCPALKAGPDRLERVVAFGRSSDAFAFVQLGAKLAI